MDTVEKTRVTTQVHEIYIRATPEAIWQSLVSPEWTARYGYHAPVEYELKRGGKYRSLATQAMRDMGLPKVIIDGEVLESRPPFKLVQTFRFLFTTANEAEGFTRLTWEIEPAQPGYCRLTVTHELDGAPLMATATASRVDGRGGGGWAWILSDIKSLLETGTSMQSGAG